LKHLRNAGATVGKRARIDPERRDFPLAYDALCELLAKHEQQNQARIKWAPGTRSPMLFRSAEAWIM